MKCSALVVFISQIIAITASPFQTSWKVKKRGDGTLNLRQLIDDALQGDRSDTSIGKVLRHPTNKRRVVLMCRNKNYLIMKDTGRITGTKNPKAVKKFGKFELQSYARGVVGIFNLRTRKFIAVDKNGKAYASSSQTDETLFNDAEKGKFHTYYSHYHHKHLILSDQERRWYLAIKKDGRLKRPSKTLEKHRSIEFLAQDYMAYKLQLSGTRWRISPQYNTPQTQSSLRP